MAQPGQNQPGGAHHRRAQGQLRAVGPRAQRQAELIGRRRHEGLETAQGQPGAEENQRQSQVDDKGTGGGPQEAAEGMEKHQGHGRMWPPLGLLTSGNGPEAHQGS